MAGMRCGQVPPRGCCCMHCTPLPVRAAAGLAGHWGCAPASQEDFQGLLWSRRSPSSLTCSVRRPARPRACRSLPRARLRRSHSDRPRRLHPLRARRAEGEAVSRLAARARVQASTLHLCFGTASDGSLRRRCSLRRPCTRCHLRSSLPGGPSMLVASDWPLECCRRFSALQCRLRRCGVEQGTRAAAWVTRCCCRTTQHRPAAAAAAAAVHRQHPRPAPPAEGRRWQTSGVHACSQKCPRHCGSRCVATSSPISCRRAEQPWMTHRRIS
mmetsp:Transcript_41261/g.132905  ORF Transcript_41261/g.132905 Transcript_41261/m.132905 type:complete len:270 (-) Transcript_41261:532-1341(-)